MRCKMCTWLSFAYLKRLTRNISFVRRLSIHQTNGDGKVADLTAANCWLVTKLQKKFCCERRAGKEKKLDKLFEQHSICGKGRRRTWNANTKRKQKNFRLCLCEKAKCKRSGRLAVKERPELWLSAHILFSWNEGPHKWLLRLWPSFGFGYIREIPD